MVVVLRVDRSLEARAERSRGSTGTSSASGELGGATSHDQPSARAADHTAKTNVSMLPYRATHIRHRPALPKRMPTRHTGTTLHCHRYLMSQSTFIMHRHPRRHVTSAVRAVHGSPTAATATTLSSTPSTGPLPRALYDALVLSSLLIVINRAAPLQITIMSIRLGENLLHRRVIVYLIEVPKIIS